MDVLVSQNWNSAYIMLTNLFLLFSIRILCLLGSPCFAIVVQAMLLYGLRERKVLTSKSYLLLFQKLQLSLSLVVCLRR